MNPGLLSQKVKIERPAAGADALGQPVAGWTFVGRISARRMKDKGLPVTREGERETERRSMVFRVRSRPFITLYQAGDRLVELAREDFPETAWKVDGWAEVEGTSGMYVDIAASVPEA